VGSFVVRYRDDEGDVIPISSDIELQEAVRQAATRVPAVIEVVVETRVLKVPEKTEAHVCEQDTTVAEEQPDSTNEIILHQAVCSICQFPIVGVRYKCAVCPNFDLCEICEMVDSSHPPSPPHLKAKRPLSPEFNHIITLSTGLHSVSTSVEKGFHNVSGGIHTGFNNVQQFGSTVGQQIKQSYKEHQPQIDAARQQAYEKWKHFNVEVKAQVKAMSESVKVKALQISETLKRESEQWFAEHSSTSTTAPATYPGQASVPAPVPMPAPVLSSSPPRAEAVAPSPVVPPVKVERQPSPTHPSAPSQTVAPAHFQQQVDVLASMGFTNTALNVTLLSRYGGDVSACVQALLESTA
jgi:hypothetical protein